MDTFSAIANVCSILGFAFAILVHTNSRNNKKK